MKKLRQRIRKIFATRKNPMRKLWRWARAPEALARVMQRWRALKEWARNKAKIAGRNKNNPERKWWLKRQKGYDDKYDAVRKRFLASHKDPDPPPTDGVITPEAPWNPYRRPIAAWIVPWLYKSWSAGWRGAVISGYRSPAYSQQLCYQICGAPSCPGTCAGTSSNHTKTGNLQGAIDVSDYYTFAAVQAKIGSPLHCALPNDRPHFSASGR